MKRKLMWILVGLLVGSGVAAATMVNAAGNKGTQIQQQGTDDANEPEDNEGAGDIEDSDSVEHEHEGTEGADDADEPGDHDGPGEVEDGD